MKAQNKNQKAPETKLTDAQLGEVNAGMSILAQKTGTIVGEASAAFSLASSALVDAKAASQQINPQGRVSSYN